MIVNIVVGQVNSVLVMDSDKVQLLRLHVVLLFFFAVCITNVKPDTLRFTVAKKKIFKKC